MSWKDIKEDERLDLLTRKVWGVPVHALADEVGMKPVTLGRRLRELAEEVEYEESLVTVPALKMKNWKEGPILQADYVMVIGDTQMPFIDYGLANKMLVMARTHMPKSERHLVVAGDFVNMDVFSAFPALHASTPSFKSEITTAGLFLEDARKVFDEENMHVLTGNHERRMLFRLLGHIGTTELGKMIGVDGVKYYEHSWMVVESGGKEWRLTHQRNYSINSQTVGKKLANKYKQNIITHHQHRMSIGYDDSGTLVIVDNGCMCNPDLLDYANLVDSTAPAMTPGFTMLREGAATLCSNDDVFTDWSLL